jgi:hypothetical protein
MSENSSGIFNFIILLMIVILIGINYVIYSKMSCPICPTCPPIKECLSCPVPSSQGLINYIINTIINDVNNISANNYDVILQKYFVLNQDITSDKIKIAFFDKIKKEIVDKKYLLDPINIVYLNLTNDDKDKFKKKYNTGIIPNPLFVINGINLIFGFQNDPSLLKIFIDLTLF